MILRCDILSVEIKAFKKYIFVFNSRTELVKSKSSYSNFSDF